MSEFDWTKITNWQLLRGSHEFPGPDGGTCINEAAIIAAGFEYKKVGGIKDLPSCFSPVLGLFLIYLNDHCTDEDRPKLMEFVHKMVGTMRGMHVEMLRLKMFVAFADFMGRMHGRFEYEASNEMRDHWVYCNPESMIENIIAKGWQYMSVGTWINFKECLLFARSCYEIAPAPTQQELDEREIQARLDIARAEASKKLMERV